MIPISPEEQRARDEWTGPVHDSTLHPLHCGFCHEVLTDENFDTHMACQRRFIEGMDAADAEKLLKGPTK